MRKVIVREGERGPGHAFILPGALKMPEGKDRIPVIVNFDYDTVVGYAEDLQREDDRSVSMEITIDPKQHDRLDPFLKDAAYSLSASHIKWVSQGINEATVRTVTIIFWGNLPPVVGPDEHQP